MMDNDGRSRKQREMVAEIVIIVIRLPSQSSMLLGLERRPTRRQQLIKPLPYMV